MLLLYRNVILKLRIEEPVIVFAKWPHNRDCASSVCLCLGILMEVYEDMTWLHLVQGNSHWQALVNVELNLGVLD
jgi:hypothetical protein